jgi:hypothetical protein
MCVSQPAYRRLPLPPPSLSCPPPHGPPAPPHLVQQPVAPEGHGLRVVARLHVARPQLLQLRHRVPVNGQPCVPLTGQTPVAALAWAGAARQGGVGGGGAQGAPPAALLLLLLLLLLLAQAGQQLTQALECGALLGCAHVCEEGGEMVETWRHAEQREYVGGGSAPDC